MVRLSLLFDIVLVYLLLSHVDGGDVLYVGSCMATRQKHPSFPYVASDSMLCQMPLLQFQLPMQMHPLVGCDGMEIMLSVKKYSVCWLSYGQY